MEAASNHLGGEVFEPALFVPEPSWQPFPLSAVGAIIARQIDVSGPITS